MPRRALALLVVSGTLGEKVANARVCASRVEICATTGADGRATLDVPSGTYLVTVTPGTGARLATGRVDVDATSGNVTTTITLPREAVIAGRVRDDAGAPVTGAAVCAHPFTRERPTCATSGNGGAFSMRLPAAAYKIDAEGPAGGRLVSKWLADQTSQERADIFDVRSADASAIEVMLTRGVVLNGTVRDPTGTPLKDAQVCTSTLAEPLPWDCERTSTGGAYRAIRLAGRYWVWVIAPDDSKLVAQWFDGSLDGFGATALDLRADRTIVFTLQSGPAITGRVTTDDGKPLGGALVCADTPFPTGRICRPSAADGSYQIATRPETYVVNVLPPEGSDAITAYWPDARTWVDAGRVSLGSVDKTLDIVLRRGVRVSGIVRDVRGVAVEGAGVNLADGDGNVIGSALSDETGRYVVVVPRGRYAVTVFAPRYGPLQSVEDLSVDANAAGVPRGGSIVTFDAVLPDGPP